MKNQTEVKEIILVGFPGLREEFYPPVSLPMFLIYMTSLSVNSTVITLVITKKRLHRPMYVIIANLAVSDLLFDTITLPKIIAKYWFGASMTFPECVLQMFLLHFLNGTDSYIFMFMSIDRYFAICQPLRYSQFITTRVVAMSCCTCWVAASSTALWTMIMNAQAPPCGYNRINTVMCLNIEVTALACVDVSIIRKATFVFAMFIQFVPLSFITLSYITIINVIRLSSSSENWRKSFYTCTTHIFAVTIYYAPRIFYYTTNQIGLVFNADIKALVLCLHNYVPHIANPIIYCLRNNDIKQTFRTSISSFLHFRVKDKILPNTITK